MPKKQIEFTIDKDGNVEINVVNIDGSDCINETKDLEAKLGIVLQKDKKPEYYRATTGNVKNVTQRS